MPLIIGFLVMALLTLLVHIADKRKETADVRRTRRLVERARREFPRNALTESLGDLYQALYKEIVLSNMNGHKIGNLLHDRDLIAAETCRLWQEEIDRKKATVDRESDFYLTSAGHRFEKTPKIRTFKALSPRQPASAR